MGKFLKRPSPKVSKWPVKHMTRSWVFRELQIKTGCRHTPVQMATIKRLIKASVRMGHASGGLDTGTNMLGNRAGGSTRAESKPSPHLASSESRHTRNRNMSVQEPNTPTRTFTQSTVSNCSPDWNLSECLSLSE